MITKLHIRNFRSIKCADLELGKITVLTGANNSGKSSFIYALLALKNIVNNPNQSIDNFLTLPFINLGGFEQTVFLKDDHLDINLGVTIKEEDIEVAYNVSLNPKVSKLKLIAQRPYKFTTELEVAFPYPVNKMQMQKYPFEDFRTSATIYWNGITAEIKIFSTGGLYPPNVDPGKIYSLEKEEKIMARIFQLPINTFSEMDFVPIRRGFTQPFYGNVPLQSQISTEEEIATLLAIDNDLEDRVAYYLQKIVDRDFSVDKIPNISSFRLQTKDNETGFTSYLVNEGLGTNQLVTILAKVLQSKNKFICIDEPEIHLHPTIIDKLVSVLIEIAEQEDKQFLVSTHSEHFITSLLTSVVKKEIKSEDVKVYYLTREGKETKTEFQPVNRHGQIEGGLKNFYASELDHLKILFKITE